jgi:hypothetical protein
MVAVSHPHVNQVKAKEPGELLHMDIVGPAQVQSDGGRWYLLVIVYDFSCYSWVFSWRVRMRLFHMLRS